MDESKDIAQVIAAYEKLLRQSGRIQTLEKKLADGTITMKEGAELNDLRAKAFGRAFSGSVPGIERGSREGACVDLLKDRCADVDELAQAAQKADLGRQGLNLTPPTAPFEEARARKIGRSLEDQTVPDETIQRRARSATENMLKSQYDRDMKQGAKTCAEAGLKTYIVRDSGAGCCKWCDEVAGKFVYGTEPKDVYRRHDNCTCSVVYESNRGKQNVWSKQAWSAEQEQKYLELRDELKAKKLSALPEGAKGKPVRLSAKEIRAIRERVGELTFGTLGSIIGDANEAVGSARYYYDRMTDEQRAEVIERGIKEDRPIFSYDTDGNHAMENFQNMPTNKKFYDICSHGSVGRIDFFHQDYPEDDYRGHLDPYTLAQIISQRDDFLSYKKYCDENNQKPIIRLFCCHTGASQVSPDCFAKLFKDEIGVDVFAPNDIIKIFEDGNWYVGRYSDGDMNVFSMKEG